MNVMSIIGIIKTKSIAPGNLVDKSVFRAILGIFDKVVHNDNIRTVHF